MAERGLLGGRAELESLLGELARELHRLDIAVEIVMVGGAWMLWHRERAATRDVDSARRFDVDISDAIGRVASSHDLSERWLNDDAAGYWPIGPARRVRDRLRP